MKRYTILWVTLLCFFILPDVEGNHIRFIVQPPAVVEKSTIVEKPIIVEEPKVIEVPKPREDVYVLDLDPKTVTVSEVRKLIAPKLKTEKFKLVKQTRVIENDAFLREVLSDEDDQEINIILTED